MALVVVGCAAAGCGVSGGDGDPAETPSDAQPSQPSTPTTSPTPPLSSTDLPTLTPPTAPPTTPSDQFTPITVLGTIERGKPSGCVLLVTSENVRYTLTGDRVADLPIGGSVKLRGMPAPHEESACPGIVLKVIDLLVSRP